jgi:hypothetical protein
MTSNRRAGTGRAYLAFAFAGVVALAGCDKGPDQAQVAADLKSSIEAELQKIEGSAAQKVLTHSAVNVTPQGDAYLVSIEGLKLQPSPEGSLEVGTITYLAKPKDEKSYEVSDLKVPQTMPFKGPDGQEKGKLAITAKSFSGVYLKELAAFQKLDGEFGDIVATDDQGGDVRIASAKYSGGITDKGAGVADAAGNLVLSGFAAKDTEGGTLSVAEMRIDGKYDSLKVADYQAAMVKYQELAVKQAALVESGASGQAASLTPEEQKALTDAISTMAASVKGGDFKIAMSGLKYNEGGTEPFSMGTLTLGMLIDGINQEKGSFAFDIGHQDLVVTSDELSSPVSKASLPKSGNLSLKITDIPSKDIVKVLADNLPGIAAADSAMAEANATAMLVALQAVLQTSGAKVEVAPSQLVSEVVEVKADGMFNVVQQSMFGLVGALNVAIRGVDDLVALAQQTPDDFEAQQVMGTAGMLQQYSAREQGADGKPVDKFKVEVNEAGQILVNGKPLM